MANGLTNFVQLVGSRDEFSPMQNSRFYVQFKWNDATLTNNFWRIAGPSTNSNQDPRGAVDANNRLIARMIKDFDFYVREFHLPNIKIGGRLQSLDSLHEAEPGYAKTILQQSLVTPQEQTFGITLIDTEISIIDNFIEPWARLVASPKGYMNTTTNQTVKNFMGYPTAEIWVYLFPKNYDITSDNPDKNAIRKYVLTNCFPSILDSPSLTHQNADYMERRVEFAFDKIFIEDPASGWAIRDPDGYAQASNAGS